METSVPYLRTAKFKFLTQLSANEIQGNTVSFRLLAEQEQSNFIIKVLEIQEGKVPSERSVLRVREPERDLSEDRRGNNGFFMKLHREHINRYGVSFILS